jgi:hypothetical protein
MKLSNIYSDLFENDLTSKLKSLKILLEREIKVGDNLTQKLQSINNGLTRKMLKFLNSDKIKDVNVDYVDYVDYDSENQQLLSLGFTDEKGNDRVRKVKVMKLLKYLGANVDDIKGYDMEELISHLQKGDTDNFKIVKGNDILKAYHCENYDEGETMGSCMRFSHAQAYLGMYTQNPNQVSCLVLLNPKNKKVRGRALLWNMDNGTQFVDRVYYTNKEYAKDFNTYFKLHGLSTSTPDGNVTLDKKGVYEYYPYLDTLMHYTPDTGVLNASYGELTLQGQDGVDTTGVYSDVHDTRIPEDEAAYVEHLEGYVYDSEVEESWKRDGTYLYRDDMHVKEITKGDYKGWYALNSDKEQEWVEDYENEIIVFEDSWYLDKGENEGYYASDGEVVQDYFDNTIMKYEAVTATLGSAKGNPILDEDAFIFISGPNKGKIFHEQDESEVKDNSKYEYVNRVLKREDYVLNENMKLNKLYKEILNEELTYRYSDTEGVEDDEYEIGMVKEDNSQTITAYHGRQTRYDSVEGLFSRINNNGTDQEGPGIYFTTRVQEAMKYASPNGYVYKVELTPNKILSNEMSSDNEHLIPALIKLIKSAPNWKGIVKGYAEGLDDMVYTYLNVSQSEKEVFLNLYHDVFKDIPKLFVSVMARLGYDALYLPAKHDGSHIVVYNPKIIRILDIEQMS